MVAGSQRAAPCHQGRLLPDAGAATHQVPVLLRLAAWLSRWSSRPDLRDLAGSLRIHDFVQGRRVGQAPAWVARMRATASLLLAIALTLAGCGSPHSRFESH